MIAMLEGARVVAITTNEITPQIEYRQHLEKAIDVYGLKQRHIAEGFQLGQVVSQSVRLLHLYKMDMGFLADKPENGLLTLAIAQDLLQTTDPAEQERLLLAFSFAAYNKDSYSTSNFNHSARIRELYRSDYTPTTPAIRRVARPLATEKAMTRVHRSQTVGKLSYQDFNIIDGFKIYGVEVKPFMLALCKRFGIDPERLNKIEIRHMLDTNGTLVNAGFHAAVERFGVGRARIITSGNIDEHILQHEGIHAILGDDLRSGHGKLWWNGVNEGWTEMMTQKPYFYPHQRGVLQAVFANSDNPHLSEYLLQIMRGVPTGRVKFMATLVQEYGLAAYTQLGLLDPEAHKHLVNEIGKVNRIFRNPEQVKSYFNARGKYTRKVA